MIAERGRGWYLPRAAKKWTRQKINLFLCLIIRYIMKTYVVKVVVAAHTFVFSHLMRVSDRLRVHTACYGQTDRLHGKSAECESCWNYNLIYARCSSYFVFQKIKSRWPMAPELRHSDIFLAYFWNYLAGSIKYFRFLIICFCLL